MAKLPKPKEWITEIEAEGIIRNMTGADILPARDALEAALIEGVIRSCRMLHQQVLEELSPEYWEDKDRVREDRNARRTIGIYRPDLMEWLSPAAKPNQKVDRTPHYDWDLFWIATLLLAKSPSGLPSKQADFVEYVQLWFDERGVPCPDEASIKEKAGRLYRELDGK